MGPGYRRAGTLREIVHPIRVDLPTTERRFLPAVSGGFTLGDREPISSGIRRVVIEQFDGAILGLVDGSDVDAAVHEARKAVKRLRATLRLVRGVIGDDVYRAENVFLRDTSRLLAPVRDGRVMVDAVGHLRQRYADHLSASAFAGVEDRLLERHERRRAHALEDADLIPTVVRNLRSARVRYAAWPTEDGPIARAYGRTPIVHAFTSVEDGLGRTYRRGRVEMRVAAEHRTAPTFHAWRKRVKYLRHQMELLRPVFPEVVGGTAGALDRLGEMLGAEHDHAVLLRLCADIPALCPDPVERSLLAAIAQHRRAELQMGALTLGARVYAEPADRFLRRMERYWDAWDTPFPVGMQLP
jgi:CHAD domain-containing protein